jgi:hypothetical protein
MGLVMSSLPAFEPDPVGPEPDQRPELRALDSQPEFARESWIVRRRSTLIRVESIEAPRTPRIVAAALFVLYLLGAVLAGNELLGWGESNARLTSFITEDVNNFMFVGAALLTGWRAWRFVAERLAWACMAAALGLYGLGDIVWSTWFADTDSPVTIADALYLAFTPLAFAAIVLLVRSRISRFELDRWIDGVAAALLVSAPAVVLILAPTAQASHGSWLTKAVSIAYPLVDIILLGAVVGVFALAGWSPGRAWVALALGLSCFVAADSFYSVENIRGDYHLGSGYEVLWPLAGVLLATAAWLRPVRHDEVHTWGWRAIALPMLCQVAPMVLMFLKHEPASEQLLMSAVLAIVLVQLVVSRPRRPATLE